MDPIYDIVPFRERRYEEITIDKVKVVNSRNRDQEQFDMNVESIAFIWHPMEWVRRTMCFN